MGVSPQKWPSHSEMVAQVAALGGNASAWAQANGRASSVVRQHILRHNLRPAIDAAVAGSREALADELESLRDNAREIVQQVSKAKTGEQKPFTEVKGDNATFVTPPAPDLGDLETLIRERGLDPEEWEVERAKLNEWDALAAGGEEPRVVKLRQLTVHLKRKTPISFVFPATDVEQRIPFGNSGFSRENRLVVFLPDQHCPYHDRDLHALVCDFLSDQAPDEIVLLGDGMDLPTISRHRDNPAWAASVQECIQSYFGVLSDYRSAAPYAAIRKLKGNHDVRLETELLTRAERMFGIAPAEIPGEESLSALSIRRLLHLDRLGVDLVEPEREGDGYQHAQIKVTPYLGARHGWLTGGDTAAKTLDRLGHSVVVGHTHHQRVSHKTVYDIEGKPRTLTAVEAGTLRQMENGYAVNPNWQRGFATATVWQDGFFKLDLATYVRGELLWHDQRYAR